MTHDHPPEAPAVPWYRTWKGLILLAGVAGGALALSLTHAEHALEALPWALLLLCPLMHLFMHGGHGKQ